MFGTFVAASEPIRFGLTHDLASQNLLVIGGREWWAMVRDVWRRPLPRKFAAVVAPPED